MADKEEKTVRYSRLTACFSDTILEESAAERPLLLPANLLVWAHIAPIAHLLMGEICVFYAK